MISENTLNIGILRLGGIACIIGGIFLAGVAFQFIFTWFPESALLAGSMSEWLLIATEHRAMAFLGIGLSIVAILSFMPFVLVLSRIPTSDNWKIIDGFSAFMLGIPLAIVAFALASDLPGL